MAKQTKTDTFETLYVRLEQSVAKLETGGLPLEQSIALYEEGMTLARQCQEMLDESEQKITKLKESFAPLPERVNGRQINDEIVEYEYVSGEEPADEPAADDDPFS